MLKYIVCYEEPMRRGIIGRSISTSMAIEERYARAVRTKTSAEDPMSHQVSDI